MEVNTEQNSGNNTENTQNPGNNSVVSKNSTGLFWRPNFIVNVANDIRRRSIQKNNPVLDSKPADTNKKKADGPQESAVGQSSGERLTRRESTKSIKDKTRRNTIINIVLVEAKGLPHIPDDGLSRGIYCKFRLGSYTFKSKSVPTTRHPQWKERFKVNSESDQSLQIALWDKGRRKNFMGSCVIDLSKYDKERTHDIWHLLDEGYGSLHLSLTICTLRNVDSAPTPGHNMEDLRSKFAFYNVSTDLNIVGQLLVRVYGAKGLNGKPNAYCTLELDNERIQTPKVSSSAEPFWDNSYVFNVYDVSSVLELKVHDSSLNPLLNNFLGRVSIPLLRIEDGQMRWYALKDNNKRRRAKGNCPRIRLEMTMIWNPMTASLKLFRPKQVKYTAKQPKFDIPLIYKNVKFIRDTFDYLYVLNECFKQLFEWEDREVCTVALIIWLTFWYIFEPWMGPILILSTFPLVYIYDQNRWWDFSKLYNGDELIEAVVEEFVTDDTIAHKVKGLPEMTLAITDGIEYMVSVAERLYNLAAFKVPFLTCLTIVLLFSGSAILYFLPFKYLMIAFGLYKFGRKRLNPSRVLNNDILDFISRIPDHKILKDWNELSVPEPQNHSQNGSLPTKVQESSPSQ